jgi:acetyltransferase
MPAPNPFTHFITPKSIAIIGASRSPDKVGHQVLANLIHDGFKGKLYPVNPQAKTILGLTCYPMVSSIPGPVDLAIIITPAGMVAPIIVECSQKKIKNAIIITAGFAESGQKGSILQQELKHTLTHYPVNVLGPNCLGVLSPTNNLNAAFGPKLPQKGSLMLISQSGALVTGIIDWANYHQIGLSHAITFGNRIDTGEIEALQFAASDPNTKTILIYLESFQNAQTFFSVCSQITPKKPIILLKGGQSLAGQTASASHTAALASDYILTQAFAKQAGVILVDTLAQWLNLAAAFTFVKPAKTTDITIITNAGGPGVLSTDEATSLGLSVPDLNKTVQKKLAVAFPNRLHHNPLDLIGDATPETFKTALDILKTDPTPTNTLIIITPQTTTKPLQTAQAIIDSKIHTSKPVYTVLIGGEKMQKAKKLLEKEHLLTYDYPTPALENIAAKSTYEVTKHLIPRYPADKPSLINANQKKKLSAKLNNGVNLATAFELLTTYNFHLPQSAIISNLDEVPDALNFVNRPAVIKTADMTLAHKASVGGVMLNVMTTAAARLAVRKLQTLHSEVLIQQTIHGQLELILGAKRDPQLGPFITVGLGGTLTNTLNDRVYAFIPATKTHLATIFTKTKAFKAITHKQLPTEAVITALIQLSTIMLDFPQIAEMEINPAILTSKKLYAADIKITLE